VPKNRAEAMSAYRKACDGGMRHGCLELEKLGQAR
jgi:hypothetical protein